MKTRKTNLRMMKLINTSALLCFVFIFGCSKGPIDQNLIQDRANEDTNGFPSASDAVVTDHLSFQTDESPVLTHSESLNPAAIVTDSSDPDHEISFNGPSTGGVGTFNLHVTDAPVAGVSALNVTISRAEVRNKATQQVVTLSTSATQINLLDLKDGLAQLLGSAALPAGTYQQLRLFITAVSVIYNGKTISISVPTSLTSEGLRLFGTFEIKSGAAANVTIDFDIAGSLIWGAQGPIFRPIAKLRHLQFQPAGIHFEDASNNTRTLVAPPGSVRAKAWVQLTDVKGQVARKRANPDGSFLFDGIARIFGEIELAVLAQEGESGFNRSKDRSKDENQKRKPKNTSHRVSAGGNSEKWKLETENRFIKLAWINILNDFSVDVRFPRILASSLDALFSKVYSSVSDSNSAFLGLFQSPAFRFLAIRYLQDLGAVLPDGTVLPALQTPYPFALEGPDYALPANASSVNSVGFYSGGPGSDGCMDAERVFDPALGSEDAMSTMIHQGLPFTGLLAEYHATCKQHDLAGLSCGTLGSLARVGSASLPAEPLSTLDRALNTPRGGLLVALLACVRPNGVATHSVRVPAFPAVQPGCWLGCGPSSNYVSSDRLLGVGQASLLTGNAESVLDLDSLVLIADRSGVDPLILAASYIADHAASRVHGFFDRKVPILSNLLPLSGQTVQVSSLPVSGLIDDRSVSNVSINGASVPFSIGSDGAVHFGPVLVSLVDGSNSINIQALDADGNLGSASIQITAQLAPPPAPSPVPAPSPSPVPAPSPSPVPAPSPSPVPTGVPGVAAMCSQGSFLPKSSIVVGLSSDINDGASLPVKSGLALAGFPVFGDKIYLDSEIISGLPALEGITVLVISRKVTIQPVSQAYIDAIKSFINQGGSVLGEYDGAALFFDTFSGSNAVMSNVNPALKLFSGTVEGGGALQPLLNSSLYVSDPYDPIMAGLPSTVPSGLRAAFEVSNYNSSWLLASATFSSAGFLGLAPTGTYPGVLSGQCGSSRVVLYTMTDLQATGYPSIVLMIQNTMHWLAGI